MILLQITVVLALLAGFVVLLAVGFARRQIARQERYTRQEAAERLGLLQGQFLDIDGLTLHVIDMGQPEETHRPGQTPTGTGGDLWSMVSDEGQRPAGAPGGQGPTPALVLIHGFGGWSWVWRKNLRRLSAAGFRVVAWDLPGFGFSQRSTSDHTTADYARLLTRVLDHLDVRRAVLVGHDLGAQVAVQAALDEPAKVSGLILVGAEPATQSRLDLGIARSIPVVNEAAVYYAAANPGVIEAGLSRLYADPSKISEEDLHGYIQPLHVRGTVASLLAASETVEETPVPSALDEIRVPALILGGREDPIAPLSHARQLDRQLPNAKLLVLDDAGHLPMEEQSETFNQLVIAFVRGGLDAIEAAQASSPIAHLE